MTILQKMNSNPFYKYFFKISVLLLTINILSSMTLRGQNIDSTITTVVDTIPIINEPNEANKYWESDYYKEIPIAQEAPTVTNTDFDNVTKQYTGPAYNYDKVKSLDEGFLSRIMRKIREFLYSLFPNSRNLDLYNVILYILIGIGIIALIYAIYKLIIGRNPLAKNQELNVDESELSFVEKNLDQVSLSPFIQKAIQNENYPLAIRYLHLQLVQSYAKKEIIEWDYRKTNQQYVNEINSNEIKDNFINATDIFNKIWFGEFTINKTTFTQYQSLFNNYLIH